MTRPIALGKTFKDDIYYCSSEDEDKWQEDDPVINCLAFGWLEDGRCGFSKEDGRLSQLCPQPIPSFNMKSPSPQKKKRSPMFEEKWTPKYVCKSVSAGSRHSLFLMIDSSRDEKNIDFKQHEFNSDDSNDYDDTVVIRKRKRPRQLLLCGLNQVGLCEEKGEMHPVLINGWQNDWDRPSEVFAGRGTSFILTKTGQIYAFGHNRYGMLGLGHCEAVISPQRISSPMIIRRVVTEIATGGFHTLCRTEDQEMYAWGRNNKGQLGIGYENEYISEPTLVSFPSHTRKMTILNISAGMYHSVALLQKINKVRRSQTWTNSVPLTGTLSSNANISNVNNTSNTRKKSIAVNEDDDDLFDTEIQRFVFCWGDESRGQLGSGDKELRNQPQENFWLTKFCQTLQIKISRIVAGGYHNLALVEESGQIVSWGAGDYGQLGHGLQFDEDKPRIINQLERVTSLHAGLRHSVAIAETNGSVSEVYVWGCNFWGQLGLGDTAVRLQPTKISAIRNSRVVQVSCGDRHTLLRLNHHPMRAKDVPALQPFFEVLEAHNPYFQNTDGSNENKNNDMIGAKSRTFSVEKQLANHVYVDYKSLIKNNAQYRGMLRALQHQLHVQYPQFDATLLEDPEVVLSDQAGLTAQELRNDVFDRGLQYCLDTKCDPFDWRRKSLEACFEVIVPPGRHLKKVCLSCARNCLHMYRLRPYIRSRDAKIDVCDCRVSGLCRSLWSPVREQFDLLSSEMLCDDGCIAPKHVRSLLKRLRAPFPVESADVEEALGYLADGLENADSPRINPVKFEDWYRKHYDEHGDDDPQQHIARYLQEQQQQRKKEKDEIERGKQEAIDHFRKEHAQKERKQQRRNFLSSLKKKV